ncbi:MAG TPA: hypothetical protein VE467_00410 [Chryseolinea sp.]|nr:hypothetical protein [Chryseolinea sp.]
MRHTSTLAGIEFIMRYTQVVIIVMMATGCTRRDGAATGGSTLPDTIYSGDFLWREKAQAKRTTILVDNGRNGEAPNFKLNEIVLVRVRVVGLTEYEMFFSEIKGATILRSDTARSVFTVKPTDSTFSFKLNQYYPKGRVFRHIRQWDEESEAYDVFTIPEDGFKTVGSIELRAN